MNKFDEQFLWNRAIDLMPRGTQTMSKCPDQYVDGVHPKFASKGKGCYIYDINGKKYIDYTCALGPIILGYNHKKTNEAIKKQLKKGINFSLPTLLESVVAELITLTVPCAEQVRFAKNGTDATLAAVRIARSFTNREHIAKCGYHGWGDWHAITMRSHGVPKSLKDIIHEFEYNNIESLECILQSYDCAAIIMEAQSLTAPNAGFLESVRDLATKYGTLLIFDEVVTGYRWSLGGAQAKFNVTPDLACLGKAMANGMPLSAIVGKRKYMSELNHAFFSMTAGGECLSLAACESTINELMLLDYSHIWNLGDKLSKGICDAAQSHGLNVSFKGSAPRHNLTFDESYKDFAGMKDLFYQEMVKRGVLFGNVVYVTFAHDDAVIEKTIQAADRSFAIVKKHMNNIDKVLQGKRSVAIFRKNT